MYLGSTDPHLQEVIVYNDQLIPTLQAVEWVPALFTAFREIFDNALDEVVGHGHGDAIDVTYDPATLTFCVEDNGRGIPIDYDETHKMHKATLALTEIMAGRNFGDRGELAGLNGVGASAVAMTSEWFKIEIHRDGKRFTQELSEGNVVVGDKLQIGKAVIKPYKGNKTGTKISFKLSRAVFAHTALPNEFVRSRVIEAAACNPKVKIGYNGEVIKVQKTVEKTLFPNLKPITFDVEQDHFRSRFILLPGFLAADEHSHSVVNNIPLFNGGSHVDAFRRGFYTGLLTALERESKRRKLQPNRADISEGLLIYNITKMRAPNFDSQSKTRLINEEAGSAVKAALDDPDFFKAIVKKHSDWIEQIFQRCAERTLKKDANEAARLAKKNLRNKVPELMDANGTDRSKCILLLAEGESARSGFVAVRNPEIHGGLALRGKVLNVNGESVKTVLDNKALSDIMNAVRLVPTQRANRHALNYGKVYIAHDSDPDGLSIGALLINFFYTFWPELFDPTSEPFLYIFMTPFIKASKGKTKKYWYSHNYHEFDPTKYKGWEITRAKGLGSLTEEDWEYSIANPEVMPIVDDGKMQETLDLIFNGGRAADRREWIGL